MTLAKEAATNQPITLMGKTGWTGHMARKLQRKKFKQNLSENVKGRDSSGGHCHRWEDNIKTDNSSKTERMLAF
jgi:hypothetical protein